MSAMQFLCLLWDVNEARRSGDRAAIAEAESRLAESDAAKGYRRRTKFEPALQPGQWHNWRRKWDEHGNPLVPGVEPRTVSPNSALAERFRGASE